MINIAKGTLLWDAVLLCVFIFQHSAMKRLNFKKRLEVCNSKFELF